MKETIEEKAPIQVESGLSPLALASAVAGPVLALLVWLAPLPVGAAARHTLAIVVFMTVYWVTTPIDYGVTALIGCYLFWALHIATFPVAFSGFANSTPWFLFGAMLMGEAASDSGLARRIGFGVIQLVGTSYARLLLGLLLFVFILNFMVPSGLAQLAITAPIAIGIIDAFGASQHSNIAVGLFIMISYTSGLFNKMLLAGGASILTQGMLLKLTGIRIFWGPYFIAYLPATLVTIFACWLIILWLYPPETKNLPGGRRYLHDAIKEMGRWTTKEKKTLAWLLFAIALWSTDFLHHISPAVVALGVGLMMALPKVGVLSTKEIRKVNLLIVFFIGGVLSMSTVMKDTKALDFLSHIMLSWMTPLLSRTIISANVLYWAGFVYHFFLASELSMLGTTLPAIVHYASTHGYNPVAFAMVWNFASAGKIFAYQSAVLILGYAYGYFRARDLLRVGSLLTVVESLLLFIIVPFYWPLIGLHWRQ